VGKMPRPVCPVRNNHERTWRNDRRNFGIVGIFRTWHIAYLHAVLASFVPGVARRNHDDRHTRLDPRIHRGEKDNLRGSARRARNADSRGVNFREGLKEIESSNAIPELNLEYVSHVV